MVMVPVAGDCGFILRRKGADWVASVSHMILKFKRWRKRLFSHLLVTTIPDRGTANKIAVPVTTCLSASDRVIFSTPNASTNTEATRLLCMPANRTIWIVTIQLIQSLSVACPVNNVSRYIKELPYVNRAAGSSLGD